MFDHGYQFVIIYYYCSVALFKIYKYESLFYALQQKENLK